MALTQRCSSHPSYSQERSSGPSLLSTRNPLVQWAATCELLGNSGAAPSSGHRACRHRLRLPSGGYSYMTWWLGCALWVSRVSMAGSGAWASVSAVEAAVRGRAWPQEWPAELLQFRLIWDAPTDQSAAWCACVETRPCARAATGVVREAMEATGMVCRRRLVSARPCKGTECARVSVDCMDSQKCARPVCVYSL